MAVVRLRLLGLGVRDRALSAEKQMRRAWDLCLGEVVWMLMVERQATLWKTLRAFVIAVRLPQRVNEPLSRSAMREFPRSRVELV